ncbi:MAG TPA: tetratricopeptide repeat protein [Candidatus Hydrogenedentes bacterium]|nr:tetratricopeptide repeat protein [Candidatus Hydrogenedentota bacterium]
MTNEEAKELYQQAMAHLEGGRFSDAFDLFNQLDAERPNSRHVTYYRGRCLAELGRLTEARECCQRIENKMEKERLDELRDLIANKQLESKTATQAPPPPDETGPSAFIIESVFPVATDQTTVTGRVKSGLLRVGDALTLVSPAGIPVLAPILRIGTAEMPLNLVRAGQNAVLLLRAEADHVAPGSLATAEVQEDSYAKTMVVSTDTPSTPVRESAPELSEVERMVKRGKYEDAKVLLDAYVISNAQSITAYRLLSRIYLDQASPLRDARKALEAIRTAYELGGAEDPAVIYTLSESLAATGEAAQGLRFLERLHGGNLPMEARAALAQRIHDFRVQYGLGHVWEFADQYGEVVFESAQPQDIVKALRGGVISKESKCRRDRIGEWRAIETALAPEYPEIAAFFKAPPPAKNYVWPVLIAVLGVALAIALLALLLR